ncbi:Aldehyde dehydrogenase, conserved site [Fusarium austroafricanum]|uniref:Aldehyde dehydrogenase, conserved site n=1 Tax=Fusarium austroafricanum TaxID=2364996 RepID=A0A8H4KRN8_9HYPO|nr:Aldehyde dehydrogenase, conserved site [Fusarium austroafricanum]
MSPPVPTYVLAPNFSYHPNTSICMGDIIRYPEDPTKPLSSIPESMLQAVTSHFDYDNELSNQNASSLRGSIWANFLHQASATLGGGTADELLTKYSIRRLETIYFTKQPTDEEAAERVKENKVQAAINSGILGKKPVFMITGLKVARGFQLSSIINLATTHDTKFNAKVTSDFVLGADTDCRQENNAEQKYRTEQDFIFAYQLHIITHKGWFWEQQNVDITVHKASAAFLNNDKKEEEKDSICTNIATESILRAFDKKPKVEAASANDGEQQCVCFVLREG